MITTVTWGATGVLAVVAAVADVRTRRVPNALTFGAAAAGMGYATVHGGLGGLESSVLGCLIGVGLFLPLFALGGMGGGDVKLLAAFGAWLGPLGVLWAAIWASLAGGILALAVSIRRRYLREALRNVAAMASVWRAVGPSPIAGMTLAESSGPRLAYAVAIGIGAVLSLWFSIG